MNMGYKMAIFDLDGVLVDTAKYHYLAWKKLADQLGIDFTHEHNERLKGVSREQSLEFLLEAGNLEHAFSKGQKRAMAKEKNEHYVTYIHQLTQEDLLPGSKELLLDLRSRGIKTGLGSASKNAPTILNRLGITELFDVIIDGNSTQRAKPDPEVFLLGAQALNLVPVDCIVFEDAQAGIDAALAAGMAVIAVGSPQFLQGADIYVADLSDERIRKMI